MTIFLRSQTIDFAAIVRAGATLGVESVNFYKNRIDSFGEIRKFN